MTLSASKNPGQNECKLNLRSFWTAICLPDFLGVLLRNLISHVFSAQLEATLGHPSEAPEMDEEERGISSDAQWISMGKKGHPFLVG